MNRSWILCHHLQKGSERVSERVYSTLISPLMRRTMAGVNRTTEKRNSEHTLELAPASFLLLTVSRYHYM